MFDDFHFSEENVPGLLTVLLLSRERRYFDLLGLYCVMIFLALYMYPHLSSFSDNIKQIAFQQILNI